MQDTTKGKTEEDKRTGRCRLARKSSHSLIESGLLKGKADAQPQTTSHIIPRSSASSATARLLVSCQAMTFAFAPTRKPDFEPSPVRL